MPASMGVTSLDLSLFRSKSLQKAPASLRIVSMYEHELDEMPYALYEVVSRLIWLSASHSSFPVGVGVVVLPSSASIKACCPAFQDAWSPEWRSAYAIKYASYPGGIPGVQYALTTAKQAQSFWSPYRTSASSSSTPNLPPTIWHRPSLPPHLASSHDGASRFAEHFFRSSLSVAGSLVRNESSSTLVT